MRATANKYTTGSPSTTTTLTQTDRVISSVLGYLLPFFSPVCESITLSLSLSFPLLLKPPILLLNHLHCNADLRIEWGMGVGGWGERRFVERLWLVLSMTWQPCCASAGGLAWAWGGRVARERKRERESFSIHDSDIRYQHTGLILK